jgi:hypothetical protein
MKRVCVLALLLLPAVALAQQVRIPGREPLALEAVFDWEKRWEDRLARAEKGDRDLFKTFRQDRDREWKEFQGRPAAGYGTIRAIKTERLPDGGKRVTIELDVRAERSKAAPNPRVKAVMADPDSPILRRVTTGQWGFVTGTCDQYILTDAAIAPERQ